ncbi:hypothetical protein, partial [Proteus faecis]|uniref:hypothetical protein n=1 Tax=Proteus faecis TaxID=2050967 RepID=UPI00301BFA6C
MSLSDVIANQSLSKAFKSSLQRFLGLLGPRRPSTGNHSVVILAHLHPDIYTYYFFITEEYIQGLISVFKYLKNN